MFLAESGLWLASIQGKYWPWKVALHQAWLAHRATNPQQWSPGVPTASRSARTVAVMVSATVAMDNVDYSVWVQHCGKNVCHHSGFLALLLRMDLLTAQLPAESQSLRVWTPVRLSVDGKTRHFIPPSPEGDTVILEHFSRYVAAADALRESLASPPRTCLEWAGKVDALLAQMKVIKSRSFAGTRTYLPLWTFRTAAYARMQARSFIEPQTCQPILSRSKLKANSHHLRGRSLSRRSQSSLAKRLSQLQCSRRALLIKTPGWRSPK